MTQTSVPEPTRAQVGQLIQLSAALSVAPGTTHPARSAPSFFWVLWSHSAEQGVLTQAWCDHCSVVKDVSGTWHNTSCVQCTTLLLGVVVCDTHNSGQGVLTMVSCDRCSAVKDAYSGAEGGIRSAAGLLYVLSLDMQGCVKDVLTVVESVH